MNRYHAAFGSQKQEVQFLSPRLDGIRRDREAEGRRIPSSPTKIGYQQSFVVALFNYRLYNARVMNPEAKRALTASITGIDGAGKSTVSDIITNTLGADTRIGKISRPAYSFVEGTKRMEYARLMGIVDFAHNLADRTESRRLSLYANALDVILQGRVIEPGFLRRIQPQLVLGTRDYLIDPAVYAIYYSPALARHPVEERIDLLKGITGLEFRDVIFLLTVAPDEAVSRIERRIAAESAGHAQSTRLKWRHMHEQEEYLDRLQKEFHTVLNYVSGSTSSEINVIDTSCYTQEQVAEMISDILNERMRDLHVSTK